MKEREDAPSPNYVSARESAIDEQAAEYDDDVDDYDDFDDFDDFDECDTTKGESKCLTTRHT